MSTLQPKWVQAHQTKHPSFLTSEMQPQRLRAAATEAGAAGARAPRQEEPPRWEARAPPLAATGESPRSVTKTQPDQKNKQISNKRNMATQKSQTLFHPTAAAAPVQRLSLQTAPQ